EKGTYGAVDFGGTNLRVMKVALDGQGGTRVTGFTKHRIPLNVMGGPAAKLFDYFARKIWSFLFIRKLEFSSLKAGFTFSYSADINSANVASAVVVQIAKKLTSPDLVGKDVGAEMATALQRNQVHEFHINVIGNDTVQTLIAGAYRNAQTVIGAIAGTGFN